MTCLARGSQRLLSSLGKTGKLSIGRNLRHASRAVNKCKLIDGDNGEKIFSLYESELDFPSVTIPEFVWENIHQWENNIAIECGITGKKYTYAQSRDASNYLARSLRNLGLRKGDVVAVLLPNLPESAITYLGILEARIVVTPVNPLYTADEIRKQLKDSGAKAIIAAAEIAQGAIAAAEGCLSPDAPRIIVEDGFGQIPEGTILFNDLIEKGKRLPPLSDTRQDPNDLAVLPYSSGTTGLPKGVELTHRNLVTNMVMVDNSLDPATLANANKDVIPAFLPFFHIYGMNVLLLPKLHLGSKLITLPKFTPDTFLNVLDKHQCTQLFCVPPIVLFLGASPLVKTKHLSTMREIFSGAAPLAESDIRRVYNKFDISPKNLNFLQGYGMTECSGVAFLESSNTKYASIGHPVRGTEVRLVEPVSGRDISTPGQTGELWLRGLHIMKAYNNNPEATSNTLVDDWLKTGDIAYFDDERDFFITDRLKELIKVKGFQVPPAELEAILRTHPDVEDAAVIGVPDPRSGEVPKAFVVKKKGTEPKEEDVRSFLKGKVSEYKDLAGGVVFIESIPRNSSGKILRVKLKDQFS